MRTLLMVLLMISAQRSYSQCAIYWAENKVAGIAYRAEGERPYTMEELKQMALDECKRRGGSNCKLLTTGYEGGWWGVLIGQKADGKYTIESLRNQPSESIVREKLFAAFRKDGGIKESEVLFNAWHVKGN